MSCFIVSDFHINALISWAWGMGIKLDYCPAVAAELLAVANRRAYSERYQGESCAPFGGYRRENVGDAVPVEILKACRCLEYQASDWSGWDTSDAARVLRTIRAAAESELAQVYGRQAVHDNGGRSLPGYDAAAWELRDPESFTQGVDA
jgi:hypothetical protein